MSLQMKPFFHCIKKNLGINAMVQCSTYKGFMIILFAITVYLCRQLGVYVHSQYLISTFHKFLWYIKFNALFVYCTIRTEDCVRYVIDNEYETTTNFVYINRQRHVNRDRIIYK